MDIHEDIGHTFVHFLYSGSYETIISPLGRGVDCIAREYRRSVLVYEAARTYDIPDLEALARKYIEHFGMALSLFDVLRTIKEVFSKLPEDESWVPLYVKQKLKQSFLIDESIFTGDEFFGILGEDRYFSNTVFKMIIDIYSTRLQLLESQPTHESSINGHLDMGRIGSESPAVRNDDDEYPAPYEVRKESPSEEASMDDSSPVKPYPVKYCPQSELKEASPEPPSVDDYAPELAPPESYPEECAPEDPADKSLYPPGPRSLDYYAEEPAPAPEPCPVEDCIPESTPYEPYPEECPPEAPAEGSRSLPRPCSVDDYSDEPVPEPYPVEDYVPEPAPPEPYLEYSQAEPTTEELPSPPEENLVRTSTAANLMANISLYNDWEALSKKGKVKRRGKLRKMGLPVPT